MQYIPPIGKTGEAAYVDGDPAANIEGDPVSAKAWEHPMREILAVIEGAGLTPDGADLTQLYQAVREIERARVMNIARFTAIGTTSWVVPHDVTSVLVEVWGGGGGGSGGQGGSGGGGGYALKVVDVAPGEMVDVTVGAGGASATYPASAGSGGTSSFGTYVSATGGIGGEGAGGAGGDGIGGDVNRSGGPGSDIGTYSRADGGNAAGGGSGGRASNNATPGVAPGGGGSARTEDAGAGAPGEVIVRYWA